MVGLFLRSIMKRLWQQCIRNDALLKKSWRHDIIYLLWGKNKDRNHKMSKRYSKYFKIMTIALLISSVLVTPLSVFATVQTDIDERREDIRSEREVNREEGSKAGNKLEIIPDSTTTVAEILAGGDLSQEQIADIIGKISQRDYQRSGILASVTAAQCILESGYLSTSLATEANNCFGMKATLSGNTWANTTWGGEIFTKQTWEEYSGKKVTIMADFRAYPNIEASLGDHSAYLLGAQNGAGLRYAGLQGETDYRRAIQIIKDGGYATDSRYVDKVCSIIERFNLTQYDVIDNSGISQEPLELFRVRKKWEDVNSQLGAFASVDNAKAACKDGYKVFDPSGEVVFEK